MLEALLYFIVAFLVTSGLIPLLFDVGNDKQRKDCGFMHIDELIEKLQEVKSVAPNAEIYFTANINHANYEVEFDIFFLDRDANTVEMLFKY